MQNKTQGKKATQVKFALDTLNTGVRVSEACAAVMAKFEVGERRAYYILEEARRQMDQDISELRKDYAQLVVDRAEKHYQMALDAYAGATDQKERISALRAVQDASSELNKVLGTYAPVKTEQHVVSEVSIDYDDVDEILDNAGE